MNNTELQSEVIPASEPVQKTTKKKTKFVNLYSQEGKNAQVVLIKGIILQMVPVLISEFKLKALIIMVFLRSPLL